MPKPCRYGARIALSFLNTPSGREYTTIAFYRQERRIVSRSQIALIARFYFWKLRGCNVRMRFRDDIANLSLMVAF